MKCRTCTHKSPEWVIRMLGNAQKNLQESHANRGYLRKCVRASGNCASLDVLPLMALTTRGQHKTYFTQLSV